MNYDELISQELGQSGEIESNRKLVQFENRVQFLIALKSGGQQSRVADTAITKDLAEVSRSRSGWK